MIDQSVVRPNWREIPVVDLTNAEVDQMSNAEVRWCLDLLVKRRRDMETPAADESPLPEQGGGA